MRELHKDNVAKIVVKLSIFLGLAGGCSAEVQQDRATSANLEGTMPLAAEFERKEAALIYMAKACPFHIGDSFDDCKRIIVNSAASAWTWHAGLNLRPDGSFSRTTLWGSVLELPLWGNFTHELAGDTVLQISGQLSLRFVGEELVEVTFQEGTPGLLLGMKRIIEPSPMSAEIRP